jgi:hypothetical protein
MLEKPGCVSIKDASSEKVQLNHPLARIEKALPHPHRTWTWQQHVVVNRQYAIGDRWLVGGI